MLDLIRHYQLDIMLMLGSVCLAFAYNLPRRPLPADTWTIDAAGGRRPHLLETGGSLPDREVKGFWQLHKYYKFSHN